MKKSFKKKVLLEFKDEFRFNFYPATGLFNKVERYLSKKFYRKVKDYWYTQGYRKGRENCNLICGLNNISTTRDSMVISKEMFEHLLNKLDKYKNGVQCTHGDQQKDKTK